MPGNKSPLIKYGIPIAIFILIVLCIGLPRLGMIYSWNDSPSIFNTTKILSQENISPSDYLETKLKDVWSSNSDGGYRPLSSLLSVTEMVFFVLLRDTPSVPIMNSMIILGLAGVLLYLLVMELFNDKLVAVSSVFLFTFSLPVITGSWIVVASKQPIAYFFLVFGMFCYVKFDKTHKYFWFILFLVSGVIGPLFREFTGIVPLVVLLNELFKPQKNKPIILASILLFAHSLLPSYVIKLIIYGAFSHEPIFMQGSLGAQMSKLQSFPLRIHHEMPLHLILLFPPTLTIITGISILAKKFALKTKILSDSKHIASALLVLAIFGILTFSISADLSWEPNFRSLKSGAYSIAKILPILIVLVFSLTCFNFGKLIPIWFMISWLPFLKIFTEEVHLAYAMIPMSVLYSLWIRDLVKAVKEKMANGIAKAMLVSIVLVGTVGYLEHSLNLYAAYSTFTGINKSILEISNWMSDNVEDEGIIVANFLHAEDISYYSKGKVEAYWTIESGIPDLSRSVMAPSKLADMIETNFGKRDIYFLAGEMDFLPSNRTYLKHTYINAPPGTLDLANEFNVEITYPFIDPFKHLVPRFTISFAGPPDLVAGFVVDNHIFYRGCSVRYDLYRLTDVDNQLMQGFKRSILYLSPQRKVIIFRE